MMNKKEMPFFTISAYSLSYYCWYLAGRMQWYVCKYIVKFFFYSIHQAFLHEINTFENILMIYSLSFSIILPINILNA